MAARGQFISSYPIFVKVHRWLITIIGCGQDSAAPCPHQAAVLSSSALITRKAFLWPADHRGIRHLVFRHHHFPHHSGSADLPDKNINRELTYSIEVTLASVRFNATHVLMDSARCAVSSDGHSRLGKARGLSAKVIRQYLKAVHLFELLDSAQDPISITLLI